MAYQNVNFSDLSNLNNELLRKFHPKIMKRLKWGNFTSRYLTVVGMPGFDGEYVMPSSKITTFMQGWQKAFVRKGQVSLNAEKTRVRRSMINWGYHPQEYYEKWFSKLDEINMMREMNGQPPLTSKQYPFTNWLIDYIMQGLTDEEEKMVAVKGVYKEPVADKPQRTKYSVDGLYTIMKRMIKEGKILVLLNSTYDNNTVIDFVEDFFNEVDDIYQIENMQLFSSIKDRRGYGKNYKDAYADNIAEREMYRINNTNTPPIYIEDSNTEIVGLPGWTGLKTMLITPKENVYKVWSEYMDPMENKVPIKEHLIIGDWGRAYGIGFGATAFVAGEVIEPPNFEEIFDITNAGFTIKIEEVPEATGYRYDVATDAAFANIVLDNVAFANITPVQEDYTLEDGSTDSYTFNVNEPVAGLNAATTYYVRTRAELTPVAGENAGTTYTSQNSAVLSVTTLP